MTFLSFLIFLFLLVFSFSFFHFHFHFLFFFFSFFSFHAFLLNSLSRVGEPVEEIEDLPGLSEEREIYLGRGEDLVNDKDILRRFDLHVNTRFHFISCRLCGYILTGSWENHVQRHYAKVGIKKWAPTEEEKAEVANLRGNTPTTTDFYHGMEPIQGIAIFDGFVCRHCDYVGKSEKTMGNHASQSHTSSEFDPTRLQRPLPTGKGNVNYRVGLFDSLFFWSFFLQSSPFSSSSYFLSFLVFLFPRLT